MAQASVLLCLISGSLRVSWAWHDRVVLLFMHMIQLAGTHMTKHQVRSSALWTAKIRILNSRWRLLSRDPGKEPRRESVPCAEVRDTLASEATARSFKAAATSVPSCRLLSGAFRMPAWRSWSCETHHDLAKHPSRGV